MAICWMGLLVGMQATDVGPLSISTEDPTICPQGESLLAWDPGRLGSTQDSGPPLHLSNWASVSSAVR